MEEGTGPIVLAGSLWFDTRDLMESFYHHIEEEKNVYVDMVRGFLDDAAVEQHGQDTDMICRRALSLAESAEGELMQELSLCSEFSTTRCLNIRDDKHRSEDDDRYQGCMKMLHDMHVRLHGAMLQQTTERVYQQEELQALFHHAAVTVQKFSQCLMEHMQEALLEVLARKRQHAEAWQSTLVRMCYEEMSRCDKCVQDTIETVYDSERAMEHAIRQGIEDRLQLEQDVRTAVSTAIDQRSEETKTRMEAIKAMNEEMQEKKCSIRRLVKDIEREEQVLQKMQRSNNKRMDQIRDTRECMAKAQIRIQARYDKAASFLHKMTEKNTVLKQSRRHVQARNKLVRYKISRFNVLHTRLRNALLSIQSRATPDTQACLESMIAALNDLSTHLEDLVSTSVDHDDLESTVTDQGWSTPSFWQSIGVPPHIRRFLTERRQSRLH